MRPQYAPKQQLHHRVILDVLLVSALVVPAVVGVAVFHVARCSLQAVAAVGGACAVVCSLVSVTAAQQCLHTRFVSAGRMRMHLKR